MPFAIRSVSESLEWKVLAHDRRARLQHLTFEDLLPSPDAGPDAVYARRVLLDEVALALSEPPQEQRERY